MTRKPNNDLGQQLDWQMSQTLDPPELTAEQLHIWCLPLTLPDALVAKAISLLNDTQRDRYHRRHTPELQQRYLAGRFHLMNLLSGYDGRDPRAIELSYTRLNKPYLNPNPLDLRFNFSDTALGSQAWGLFGFTRGRDVGVDIEFLNRSGDFEAIAERRMGVAELNYIKTENAGIDAGRFLSCWTRKEAYGKASGKGINFKMRELDLATPGQHELQFIDNHEPSNPYSLHQFYCGDGLIAAAVVSDHRATTLRAFTLDEAGL
ncbi:MAG: 4'-phosphopantetheinyl transferase superfamily protein [Gammaproteobacteria bacterium]|nr:4'-phosphopantetheinyl transferase superfamily protein [Gammaproteobacteria bacterium]